MELQQHLEELKPILKIDQKRGRILAVKEEMDGPDFWLDEKKAAKLVQELSNLERDIKEFDDLYEMSQLAQEEDLKSLTKEVEKLELKALFTGKYDSHNAIVSFYAGAGGVDAQDWNEMLLRMYLRFAEKNGMKAQILEESRGTEAGIKSATVEISGGYTYGKLRCESGVHRLVRQSPYNAKSLRQTSFALVLVMPEIENDSEVEIDSKDLRIDTFCAGGHGGQSVNTTYSAVRITHLPTGIVASCQNERSQMQNKEMAMKILRSRIASLLLEQHKEKIEELKGNFSSPEWGNQIRSYVLHPYKLVKDHRTDHESTNPDDVLDGNLNDFIESELKSGICNGK